MKPGQTSWTDGDPQSRTWIQGRGDPPCGDVEPRPRATRRTRTRPFPARHHQGARPENHPAHFGASTQATTQGGRGFASARRGRSSSSSGWSCNNAAGTDAIRGAAKFSLRARGPVAGRLQFSRTQPVCSWSFARTAPIANPSQHVTPFRPLCLYTFPGPSTELLSR